MPFIAWWPGRVHPASSANLGYFGDVMATLADLAGAKPPSNIDSISIAPTLLRPRVQGGRAISSLGQTQAQHRYLYFEFHEGGFSQAVIIDGRWKAIRMRRLDAPIEIYDMQVDPSEKRNVAESHPSVLKQAELVFRTERTDSPLWPIKESTREAAGNAPARNRNR